MIASLSELIRGKKKAALRVAYIDDDLGWHLMVDNQLHQFGIHNEVMIDREMFIDGQKFMDYLGEGHKCFDLIITDLFMPVLSGFAMIQQLEANGCESIIIAVTANSRLPKRLSIVHKPFNIKDIMRRYIELRGKPIMNALQLGMCLGRERSYV